METREPMVSAEWLHSNLANSDIKARFFTFFFFCFVLDVVSPADIVVVIIRSKLIRLTKLELTHV